MSTPVKRVQIFFSPEEIDRLRAIARTQGKTLAALIREAVQEVYLETEQQQRLEAVRLLAKMNLPVSDWQQMERESAPDSGLE
jgi:hypothetical protein